MEKIMFTTFIKIEYGEAIGVPVLRQRNRLFMPSLFS